MPSMYKHLGSLYVGLRNKIKKPEFKDLRGIVKTRAIEWGKGEAIIKEEKPIRLDKARMYGYKAKKGFIAVISRVRRGGRKIGRPSGGRKPTGWTKLTPKKSIQRMAEERAQRKFMNLEVLSSYKIYQDGKYKFFEVILVDPNAPEIKSDKTTNWICEKQHRHRVFRGLTPAAKKSRNE